MSSSPTELNNICFMGTSVESGTATAVVVTTGVNTYLGSMAGSITEEPPPTSFDQGLSRFTWLMIRLMAVMVPLVFLINGFTKHDWKSAFFFAMAVAVGLTPEMLPMIVSVCLSKGALAMSRKKVIVKRLNAIQNFGGMDVLCTDKTGTLTEDRVVLQRHCNVAGEESEEVLLDGYLISHFQTGLKNLLDRAILNSSDFHGQAVVEKYKKLDEIPFDFTRRMMSVLVEDPEGKAILLTKGAPEEVFHQCSHFELDGKVSPMDPDLIVGLKEEYESLSNDGFRVLAVATKELPGKQICSKDDERDLVLKGYVAFLDPPKSTAGRAIEALHNHGVAVKILTGDNQLISRKVCKDVGLSADPMLLGGDVEKMSDAELADAAEKATLFARLSPAHKQRVIRVLRGKGHVVGFMGDGINDAPALQGRGHRHLGGYGHRHRQGVGGSDPAGEGSHGAGRRRDRGPEGLREHPQVHSDGGQFQLRQHVQRAGRERLPAFSSDGSDPGVDQQSALRLLASTDPDRCRGRRAGGAPAALEHRRDHALHSFHRPHQLDLRLYDLLRHALGFQLLGSLSRVGVSDRLVRRVADDADAHHSRDSDQ